MLQTKARALQDCLGSLKAQLCSPILIKTTCNLQHHNFHLTILLFGEAAIFCPKSLSDSLSQICTWLFTAKLHV